MSTVNVKKFDVGKLTKITNGNVSTGTNQYTYTYNGLGQNYMMYTVVVFMLI